jgi:hypothetical protein
VRQVQAIEQEASNSTTEEYAREEYTRSMAPVSSFKYYLHDNSDAFRFQLIGQLTAASLAELDGCWRTAQSCIAGRKVCLDLRGLNMIDEPARMWLKKFLSEDSAECLVTNTEFFETLRKQLGIACHPVDPPIRQQPIQRRLKGWLRSKLSRRGAMPQSDDPSFVLVRCR